MSTEETTNVVMEGETEESKPILESDVEKTEAVLEESKSDGRGKVENFRDTVLAREILEYVKKGPLEMGLFTGGKLGDRVADLLSRMEWELSLDDADMWIRIKKFFVRMMGCTNEWKVGVTWNSLVKERKLNKALTRLNNPHLSTKELDMDDRLDIRYSKTIKVDPFLYRIPDKYVKNFNECEKMEEHTVTCQSW